MWEQRKRVLGSVRRFVGAVGGLGGCETDAVMALDLGGMSVVLWGVEEVGRRYHDDCNGCEDRLVVGETMGNLRSRW